MSVRLDWEGKPTEVERLSLPFQTVETINESRATRERDSGSLLKAEKDAAAQRNRLIWGDNKLVMTSLLAEYAGHVDLVYIDPPFATGDDFSVKVQVGDTGMTKERSVLEEHAYRDTWGRGNESYLSMMYERLVLIHELLSETGAIYLHCAPNVSHFLKILCDEIFGADNFRNEIIWKRTSAHSDAGRFGRIHDVLLFYTRSSEFTWNPQPAPQDEENFKGHDVLTDDEGRAYRLADLSARSGGETLRYSWQGHEPPKGRYWAYSQESMDKLEAEGRIAFNQRGKPRLKRYLDELPGIQLQDVCGLDPTAALTPT